ncbi:MAG: hypothetical protein IJS78_04230 [Clostridia bacterium]|nr:hypothetical protein [Clostridia bacterium]
MNNAKIKKFSEEKGINKYELVIATAKTARIVTDDFILQKELADRLAGKETDKPVPILVDEKYKDEKPVQSAVELLTKNEFRIVESSLPESKEKEENGGRE